MKQEILKDESRFQRACSRYVERNVICCVSSLMYDIGQNLEACAKIFDFDYDEAVGWYQRDDWDEAVEDYIRNEAPVEQIEEILGEALDNDNSHAREKALDLIEDNAEFGRENNLDPYVVESLEFWVVDKYFARELKEQGETVFEFADFTVWARTTFGQSISIDGVVRRLIRSFPDDHWVWND